MGELVKEYVRRFLEQNTDGVTKLLVNEAAVENASLLVMNIISFVVVILASKLVIALLVKILNIVSKLPVIKQANKLLGMVAGICSGLLVCYIAAGIIMMLSPEGGALPIKESLETSRLAVKLCDKNIIYDLLKNLIG